MGRFRAIAPVAFRPDATRAAAGSGRRTRVDGWPPAPFFRLGIRWPARQRWTEKRQPRVDIRTTLGVPSLICRRFAPTSSPAAREGLARRSYVNVTSKPWSAARGPARLMDPERQRARDPPPRHPIRGRRPHPSARLFEHVYVRRVPGQGLGPVFHMATARSADRVGVRSPSHRLVGCGPHPVGVVCGLHTFALSAIREQLVARSPDAGNSVDLDTDDVSDRVIDTGDLQQFCAEFIEPGIMSLDDFGPTRDLEAALAKNVHEAHANP